MELSSLLLAQLAVDLVLGYGWCMNIVTIYNSVQAGTDLGSMFVFRCIGIIVVPLGAILGYF